ncbi:ribonuclease H-like protein [Lenzites betulinus]|nr:ribonuclease H-like protein [Lenzites betulinus]
MYGVQTFDPSITQDAPIAEAVRIFVPSSRRSDRATRAPPRPFQIGDEAVEAYTDGSCANNGTATARAGAGAWFGTDDPRNVAARVPGKVQSNQVGEIYAVIVAASVVPAFAPLTISTDSRYVYNALTRDAKKWEDKGWIRVENSTHIKSMLASLRMRSAPTYVKWVKGHSGIRGNEEADALAAVGAEMPEREAVEIPENAARFLPEGARLTTLTQRLAYAGIRRLRMTNIRTTTERNVLRAMAAVAEVSESSPLMSRIWKDLRRPEIAKKVRDFLWKNLHGIYKVGPFWRNIPGYEERGTCRICEVEETMEHILCECDSIECRTVSKLVKCILEKKGSLTSLWAYGTIMGIASYNGNPADGRGESGASRLARIVVAESAHLIWKLRCQRVIEWCDDQQKEHCTVQVTNKWYAAMNARLKMDIALTHKRWASSRIQKSVVLATWRGVVRDEKSLPDDWTSESGVLVGRLENG